jgi:hypothetical protein
MLALHNHQDVQALNHADHSAGEGTHLTVAAKTSPDRLIDRQKTSSR